MDVEKVWYVKARPPSRWLILDRYSRMIMRPAVNPAILSNKGARKVTGRNAFPVPNYH